MVIDTSDKRTVKAIDIAAEAGQWARIVTADGSRMFGIPSSTDPLHLYLTTRETCSCPSFAHSGRACKHCLAVQLHLGLSKAVQPVRRMPRTTKES